MTYHKYKNKVVKGLAILMASMMLLGALAPVVFADEGSLQKVEENQDKDKNNGSDKDKGGDKPPVEIKPPVWAIEGYPNSEKDNIWFNEETLYHDTRDDREIRDRLFLKVSFSTDKGELEFAGLSTLINSVDVFSDSSNISMIDTDFLNTIDKIETDSENPKNNKKQDFIDKYIFVKGGNKNKATLYIPVKPLMSHMKYSVTLHPGVVKVKYEEGKEAVNDTLTWSFNTMAIPSIAEKDVIVQSVVEDYDEDEPIIITGKFFYNPTVEVYFNDIRAHRVRVKEDNEKNEYLEVYLPRGRNRLDPGLYDITVENSYNHSKWLYGTLSVVEEAYGRPPIEEDNRFETSTQYGTVTELGRKRAKSTRLDHKAPFKEQLLRNQLTEYVLRSPIIEVDGTSSSFYTFFIEIPVDKGEYDNYKVLRYDDFSRNWIIQNDYYIDKIDQRALVTTFNSGIFVVAEPMY